jgi:hypothetical protein
MTTTAPRRPQDHKPKATQATNGLFSFTHQGKQYTFPKPFSAVQNPKFLRQHRRRDELDLTFTIIEALADDDDEILDAIDSMAIGEFNKLSARLNKALANATETSEELGESEAS